MNKPDEHAALEELTSALNGASEAQDWARAITLGERAMVLAPSSAEIREATALAYNERGNEVSEHDSAQALRDFDRSIELNPKDAIVHYNRAFAWHKLQEYTKAIGDLANAIALDATDADSYVLRARCHRALSNHREALADYTKALALNPAMQDADLFTERGLTLIALHRSDEAVADLARALEIEPTPGRWDIRAACYIGAGEYERAVSDSVRAITDYPGEGTFYRTLSVAYREGGDPARAVIECNRAIGLDPRRSGNYWCRALALAAMGREDEAQIDRHQAAAMEAAPDRAMDMFDAAWAHAHATGQVAPARAVPASEGAGPNPELHRLHAAEALYHQGRFTEAILLCRNIVATGAAAEAYGILAVSLAALGDVDAGLAEMERALILEPSYRWLLTEMGALMLRHGYTHESVQVLAAAMTEPTPQRELALGCALAAAGLRGAARPHLERAAAAGLTATAQPAGTGRVDRGAPHAIRGLIPRPALTRRRPREEITLAQRWVLATGALMTELYGGLHDALGMFPVDYIGRESAASFLGRHWSIRNRAEAVKALDWLEGGGDSEEYAQLCAMVGADDPRAREASLPNDRAKADVAFVREHQRELGTRGLLAWDLARIIGVAGWSALAGYIEEREAWDRGTRAALRLQGAYGSWQELGRHYLLGRIFAVGEVNTEAEQAYARLLSEPDSPWRRLAWTMPVHQGTTTGHEVDASAPQAVTNANGTTPNEAQIAAVEREVGLVFPQDLRAHFLRENGGRPTLNVYHDERDASLGVIVSEWLPVHAEGETAVAVYKDHVLKKHLVPRHFFPFALEPSGDYLYVDCSTAVGMVYVYRHDTAFEPIVALNVGLDQFCSRLRPGGHCPPEGYVFHYLDDYDPATNNGTIQVVQAAAHRRCTPHFGGMKQYELAHGRRYGR